MNVEAIRATDWEGILVDLDKKADQLPVVSTLTNFSELLFKGALSLMDQERLEETLKSTFFKHINDKSSARCVTLLVPVVGNGIVYLYDRETGKLSAPEVVDEEGRVLSPLDAAVVLEKATIEAEEHKPMTLVLLPTEEKKEVTPTKSAAVQPHHEKAVIKPKLIRASLGIRI